MYPPCFSFCLLCPHDRARLRADRLLFLTPQPGIAPPCVWQIRAFCPCRPFPFYRRTVRAAGLSRAAPHLLPRRPIAILEEPPRGRILALLLNYCLAILGILPILSRNPGNCFPCLLLVVRQSRRCLWCRAAAPFIFMSDGSPAKPYHAPEERYPLAAKTAKSGPLISRALPCWKTRSLLVHVFLQGRPWQTD